MIDLGFMFRRPIVQSTLAGISNRIFCQEILRYGVSMAVFVARPLIRDSKFIQRLVKDYTGQKNHGSNNNSL